MTATNIGIPNRTRTARTHHLPGTLLLAWFALTATISVSTPAAAARLNDAIEIADGRSIPLVVLECGGGSAYFGLRQDGANVGQGQSVLLTQRTLVTSCEFEFEIYDSPVAGIPPLAAGDMIYFDIRKLDDTLVARTRAPVPDQIGNAWMEFDLPGFGIVLEAGTYLLLAYTDVPGVAAVPFCPAAPYPDGTRYTSLNGSAGPWDPGSVDQPFRVHGHPITSTEQIDQEQPITDYGFWFDDEVIRWQEFAPDFDNLTAVEVHLHRMGNPGNVIVEIRTRDEDLLAQQLIPAGQVPSPGSAFVRIDMPFLVLNPAEIYRIYVYSDMDSPSLSDRYFWRGTNNSTYNPECACSVQEGGIWPTFDFAFRTYGYPVIVSVPDTPPAMSRANLCLHPNYPDPFNPLTNLRFELPVAGEVSLAVYDLKGRLIKTLASEYLAPGVYTRQWDGTDRFGQRVASGTYYCRLATKNEVVTETLLLVK